MPSPSEPGQGGTSLRYDGGSRQKFGSRRWVATVLVLVLMAACLMTSRAHAQDTAEPVPADRDSTTSAPSSVSSSERNGIETATDPAPSSATASPASTANARGRPSFPLYAAEGTGGGGGVVQLTWTPPLTRRVFPAGDGKDPGDGNAPGLQQFLEAASRAAARQIYDIEVGVCLTDDPERTDNNQPFAPLPCADAVFNVSGVEGTSYAVEDLTPGRAYSFRVVSRGRGDLTATDAGAASTVAVATASGGEAEGGDVVSDSSTFSSSSSSTFDTMVVDEAPALAFCGAQRSTFPNGTLLLGGASVRVDTPAACCLACSRATGCNAWAHCDQNTSRCQDMGVAGQCWLMYIPLGQLSKTGSANAGMIFFPVWRAGPEVPWWGGVITPALNKPPAAPTGLTVTGANDKLWSRSSDVDRCIKWDPPPPLPAPAAAAAAITTYIVRTSATYVGRNGTQEDQIVRTSVEHSALLPPQLCQCNAWSIPVPVPDDTSNEAETGDVAVTVRVVAENDAGRSPPAEIAFTVRRSEVITWAVGEGASDEGMGMTSATTKTKRMEVCPTLVEAPMTPPRGVTVQRIPAKDGGGVFVSWSAPLFASDIFDDVTEIAANDGDVNKSNDVDDKKENTNTSIDKSVAAGGEKKRLRLLQASSGSGGGSSSGGVSLVHGRRLVASEPISGSSGGSSTIGYQVTWVGWNENTMPGGGNLHPILSSSLA